MSLRREPSSPSLRRIRALSAVLAVLLAATITLVLPASPASANDVPSWLSRLNSFRQSQGLSPFTLDPQLSGLAQQQSQVMANNGALSHTPNLAAGVSANWTKLGENVGMGMNLDIIMNAFLSSAPHLANLRDPGFTHIGIGVVIVGNTQWVTHRFMGVASAPAPAPAPEPPPVTAPPAPRPTAPPTTRPPVVVTTTTTAPPPPVTVPEPEPVVVPAASAPDRAAALLDALHLVEQ
jgi:hypothetical protein